MNITDTRPFTCPHGAYQAATEASVITVYSDGCRTTGGGIYYRFWCGEGEMSKSNGVSITGGEYLAAWDEALAEDARLMEESHPDTPEAREYLRSLLDDDDRPCSFRGLISKRPCLLSDGHDEPHDVWGRAANEHADYLGEVPWTDRVED